MNRRPPAAGRPTGDRSDPPAGRSGVRAPRRSDRVEEDGAPETPDVSGSPGAPDTPGALTERSTRIAAAHRLLRKSRRAETGEFLAEGPQAVREAVAAEALTPGIVRELYITAAAGARHVEIVRAAFAAGITVTEVSERAAVALSDTVTPQGLVARCALPDRVLADVLGGPCRLVAVLVGAADPGNAGTVVRLADAAGADAVILAGESVDAFGPKAVRASAGSIFHLPVVHTADPAESVRALSAAGLSVLATTGAAALDLDTAARDGILDLPTAWLFGSEAHGLPAEIVDAADAAVRVPIHGRAESLNLATAAAICLYASASAQRRAS